MWFNLAFPGAYAPFMQILSQPQSSIYSKAWALNLNRPSNWDGDWGDWFSHWQSMRYPAVPPFDDPTPAAMGTGPFVLEELNSGLQRWSVVRNHDYWRGWPLDWPSFSNCKPAGYIEHFVVTWAYNWQTRSTVFLNGEVDICAVPRQYMSQVQGQPCIRCVFPLPSLYVDALCFQFNINSTSPYGSILQCGTFDESGVPSDFFGNASWGVHVRKAFAYAVNYATFAEEKYLGEAYHPPTSIIPILPCYSPEIEGYYFNLSLAAEELHQIPSLWDTGFTMQFLYSAGSLPGRDRPYTQIAQAINSLNPKFHCNVLGIVWSEYFSALKNRQMPLCVLGWVADYPDPHDFAYPFYHSRGNFAGMQNYSNSTMDALIDQGIRQPEGQERMRTYGNIQQLVIDDCPSAALTSTIGHRFEQTWVCGSYYNPAYPGVYAANLWKWYYTPHAQQDTVTNATANLLPYDVNYDGKINMFDIGATAASFGASYGPPISAKWNFRCDVNNDRKTDMKDISAVAKNFGKTSPMWIPP